MKGIVIIIWIVASIKAKHNRLESRTKEHKRCLANNIITFPKNHRKHLSKRYITIFNWTKGHPCNDFICLDYALLIYELTCKI